MGGMAFGFVDVLNRTIKMSMIRTLIKRVETTLQTHENTVSDFTKYFFLELKNDIDIIKDKIKSFKR